MIAKKSDRHHLLNDPHLFLRIININFFAFHGQNDKHKMLENVKEHVKDLGELTKQHDMTDRSNIFVKIETNAKESNSDRLF